MGSCANKQIVNPPNVSSKKNSSSLHHLSHNKNLSYGILKNPNQHKSLLVNHSPLKSCQFLFQKFRNSDGAPQQVSLGFMINQCKIDVNNREIFLSYITSSKANIWCIYSGIQKISETGLTIELKNYKNVELITVDSINQNEQYKSIVKISETLSDNILIVFEPLLENKQTIFMIYRYQILPEQKQYTLINQTLQWSSLAFRINDIYGAENLFHCGSQNQVCSVCLTAISQCILLPCRHMCICEVCLAQVQKMKPRCPLCRKEYYSVIKYKSGNE